jgi:hypothetical protein
MGAVDATAYVCHRSVSDYHINPFFHRRFTGDFTNVMVPADAGFSWSIPFDKLSYTGAGTAYDVPGLVASVDMLRPRHFLCLMRALVANPAFF